MSLFFFFLEAQTLCSWFSHRHETILKEIWILEAQCADVERISRSEPEVIVDVVINTGKPIITHLIHSIMYVL